jgi:UDP-3-O-[3-hydroxymyristoyl] glucosamine N-acyltransferase
MNIGNRHTVGEIALFLGGTVVGNEQQIVTGLNEYHRAGTGDLTFADEAGTIGDILRSGASVILTTETVNITEDRTLIILPDPFDAYNRLTRKFSPYRPQKSMTGEDCIIADSALLSPNCFIGHDVTIGENATIHPGAYIGDGTVIGEQVIIGPNAVIGHYGFYYKKKPEGYARMHSCGYVHIEKDAEIGALCTIAAGVSSVTRIGAGTKLDSQVHVGHDSVIGNQCILESGVHLPAFSEITSGVRLSGKTGSVSHGQVKNDQLIWGEQES